MGDEELNFTDEESRCWTDDPHNQAEDMGAPDRVLAVSVVLVFTLVVMILLLALAFRAPLQDQVVMGVLPPLVTQLPGCCRAMSESE